MEKEKMSIEPKKKKYYIPDRVLFNRVKLYLEESEDPAAINIDVMFNGLREDFKEYARRPKSAFRTMLIKTYKMALETMDDDEEDIYKNSDVKDIDDPMSSSEENDKGESEHNDDDENDDSQVGDIEEEEPTNSNSRSDDRNSAGNNDFDYDFDYDGDLNVDGENEIVTPGPPRISYIQSLQGMTNSAKQKPISITISSDEEEPPSSKYPKLFSANGALSIQAVTVNKLRKVKCIQENQFTLKHKPPKRLHENTEVPQTKKRQKYNNICTIPNVSFKLFGGFSKILQTVSELVVHVKESEIYKTLGVRPPRGFLLHGPPGCGKTLLAQAIAGELEVPMIRVAGPELVAGVSGESESRIRELFESALEQAPCILFIDEIDAICPPRDIARREMERRIVAQLLTCIDALGETEAGDKVVIIGATNRPDALDPALRRAGRFDREVCLGIPDRNARKEIIEVITEGMKLKPGLDIDGLAAATPGFVGADLKALTSEAAIASVNRCLESEKKKIQDTIVVQNTDNKTEEMKSNSTDTTVNGNVSQKENDEVSSTQKIKSDIVEGAVYLSLLRSKGPLLSPEQLSNLFIETCDFEKALKSVQPSAKREGFATVPDVTWDDIGSLKDIRNELEKSIMLSVKYPNEFSLLGINAPSGILLCGPPGCGKTLLAKAVANEANINFISVKGPELLNMYVGESERAVRQCFQRARNSQPCVIFFDEIDALCPKRGASNEGHNATSRVVNQVLTEMDGIEGRTGVFLMAATNRPDMVDPAVLRPGRLDKILFVGLPTAEDRSDILRALTKNGTKPPLKNVNLAEIGKDTRLDGYTGADLAALIKEASLIALTDYIRDKDKNQLFVTCDMIYQASSKIRPSVSQTEKQHYEVLKTLFGMPASSHC